MHVHICLLSMLHCLRVQVVVLDDEDVEDPTYLLETVLRTKPFYLIVEANKRASEYVQRLAVILTDEAFQLPLAHAYCYRQMMKAKRGGKGSAPEVSNARLPMKRKRGSRRSAPEVSNVRLPMKRNRNRRSAPEVSNVRLPYEGEQPDEA